MRPKSQNNMEDVELDDNEVLLLSAAIACASVVLVYDVKRKNANTGYTRLYVSVIVEVITCI